MVDQLVGSLVGQLGAALLEGYGQVAVLVPSPLLEAHLLVPHLEAAQQAVLDLDTAVFVGDEGDHGLEGCKDGCAFIGLALEVKGLANSALYYAFCFIFEGESVLLGGEGGGGVAVQVGVGGILDVLGLLDEVGEVLAVEGAEVEVDVLGVEDVDDLLLLVLVVEVPELEHMAVRHPYLLHRLLYVVELEIQIEADLLLLSVCLVGDEGEVYIQGEVEKLVDGLVGDDSERHGEDLHLGLPLLGCLGLQREAVVGLVEVVEDEPGVFLDVGLVRLLDDVEVDELGIELSLPDLYLLPLPPLVCGLRGVVDPIEEEVGDSADPISVYHQL